MRTNELPFGGTWELREFVLKAPFSSLVHDTIKQTPDQPVFDNSATLANFMETNDNDILCEKHTVPLTLPGPLSFRGASILYFGGDFWDAPTNPFLLPALFPSCHVANAFFPPVPTPAQMQSEVRHKFSLNTCDACHAGETNTPFTHVSPLGPAPAPLSGFLTGITVSDPVGSGINRNFNDLARRAQVVQSLATQSCTPIIAVSMDTLFPFTFIH